MAKIAKALKTVVKPKNLRTASAACDKIINSANPSPTLLAKAQQLVPYIAAYSDTVDIYNQLNAQSVNAAVDSVNSGLYNFTQGYALFLATIHKLVKLGIMSRQDYLDLDLHTPQHTY